MCMDESRAKVGRGSVRWFWASVGVLAFGGVVLSAEGLSTNGVARVGDRTVTVGEVRAAVQREGVVPYDPDAVKEMADRVVDEAVLALEARRRGLDRDPALRAEWDRRLAARLLEEEVEVPLAAWRPDEAAIRSWQERHGEQLRMPDTVSVVVLSLWLDAGGTNGLAERLRSVQAGLADGRSLADLATRWADGPSERAAEPFVFIDGRESLRQPAEVVTAALALRTPGQRSDPVRTTRGWSLVELRERRVGQVLPAEKARLIAVQGLKAERRAAALSTLVDGIRRREGIRVDAAAVASLVEKTDPRPPRPPAQPR